MDAWHIVTTIPRGEFEAVREFEDAGLEAFTPREMKFVAAPKVKLTRCARRARRGAQTPDAVLRAFPFMQRYIAVKAPSGDAIWAKRGKHTDKPLGPMRNREAETMRALDQTSVPHVTSVNTTRARRVPTVGERATVRGMLMQGLVVAIDGNRAMLEVEMLGGLRRTPIALALLEPPDI